MSTPAVLDDDIDRVAREMGLRRVYDAFASFGEGGTKLRRDKDMARHEHHGSVTEPCCAVWGTCPCRQGVGQA